MNSNHNKLPMSSSEKIIVNPYNANNILLDKSFIEKVIGYPIKDVSSFQRAFVHKSYTKRIDFSQEENCQKVLADRPSNCLPLFKESNEQIEFFGDSVVGLIVTKYIFLRFNQPEGWSTKMKTKLVNTESLAKFCQYLGLEKYLIISRHVEERCNGRKNPRILEDLFESFIGALYLEFNKHSVVDSQWNQSIGLGYHICEQLLVSILEQTVDFTDLIKHDTNYKDQLLRYYQQNYHITPKYIEVKVEGPSHQRLFTMAVLDKFNNQIAQGTDRSKKKAEQLASKEALLYLNALNESDSEESESE